MCSVFASKKFLAEASGLLAIFCMSGRCRLELFGEHRHLLADLLDIDRDLADVAAADGDESRPMIMPFEHTRRYAPKAMLTLREAS